MQAIIVYPMNALANSQLGELEKFLNLGYPDNKGPVRFRRYTGQESELEREEIIASPPDILLTNYVMLEYILTRPRERDTLVKAAQGLRFLVLDELHTYRGRQGADVALLVRRVRNALDADDMQCVGTSATVAGVGTFAEQQAAGGGGRHPPVRRTGPAGLRHRRDPAPRHARTARRAGLERRAAQAPPRGSGRAIGFRGFHGRSLVGLDRDGLWRPARCLGPSGAQPSGHLAHSGIAAL